MPAKKSSSKRESPAAGIRRSMPIAEIVTWAPGAQSILAEYGLHCFSCNGSSWETLEEGCRFHGFSDDDIDDLVTDLNDLFRDLPERPQVLTVTLAAAQAIAGAAKEEKRLSRSEEPQTLAVIADASGGFCMEFRDVPEVGDLVFGHPEGPSVRVVASPTTLRRIGGATIDFREGRFTLDLPEDQAHLCRDKTECECVKNGKNTHSPAK